MNSQLAILAVVDVEAALTEETLIGNCYLIDNNRFRGSSGQGTDRLVTVVEGNQVMNWLVAPADIFNATSLPYLTKIHGEAVERGIIAPQIFESPEVGTRGLWWGGIVSTNKEGLYNYTLTFDVGGIEMNFISSIYAKRPFSNYEPTQEENVFHPKDFREFRNHKSIPRHEP
jgi:hypothetical protein